GLPDVGHSRIGLQALDLRRLGVHRIDRSPEPELLKVVDQGAPMLPGRREAPTTATERGLSIARTLLAAAFHRRSSLAPIQTSFSAVGNETRTTWPGVDSLTLNPLAARSSNIRRLSPSTSASKAVM